jgi:predicted membrane metal-binding protein
MIASLRHVHFHLVEACLTVVVFLILIVSFFSSSQLIVVLGYLVPSNRCACLWQGHRGRRLHASCSLVLVSSVFRLHLAGNCLVSEDRMRMGGSRYPTNWATRQWQEHTTQTYTRVSYDIVNDDWYAATRQHQLGCGRHLITRGLLLPQCYITPWLVHGGQWTINLKYFSISNVPSLQQAVSARCGGGGDVCSSDNDETTMMTTTTMTATTMTIITVTIMTTQVGM